MKKKIAIIRGPNLNSWEMQNYSPLMDTYEIVGFTSYGNNYPLDEIPFKVNKLFSFGQFLKPRLFRRIINATFGDYHDLQGLSRVLQDFDIVHCVETSYYCTYQVAKIKKKHNFKLVVTVWENIPFLNNYHATEYCKHIVFDVTDLFLPTSERAKKVLLLEGVNSNKIKIQMPGINVNHFTPMQKDSVLLNQFDIKKSDFVVLYVANLYREKGLYDLIFAFRLLLNAVTDADGIKLLIAGRGKEEQNIKLLISKLQLSNNVKLIGTFPYKIMPKIHNLADIFILPSIPIQTWQEQFGYVLIESMACGKPIIATLSGSIPEVVGNAGILVQPNDFMSLYLSIEKLYQNNDLRINMSRLAREHVIKSFNIENISKQIKHNYDAMDNT